MGNIVKMLAYQNPYPACAIDRNGDIIAGNKSLLRNYKTIALLPGNINQLNILDLVLSDSGIKPYIVDWEETATYLHRIVIQESLSRPLDKNILHVLNRVETHPDFDWTWKGVNHKTAVSPVTVFKLRVVNKILSYIVSYLTLGSAYNTSQSRVHIIMLHPQDITTSKYMKQSYFGNENNNTNAFSFKENHEQ